MEYRIGTCGYSYQDWKGVFYPPDIDRGKMLDHYATVFKTVEINSTYYRIPHAGVFYHLDRKTPPDFEFIVKVNQETTHARTADSTALAALCEAVRPLIEAGKFCGFLAQFPYAFKNTQPNREYLCRTRERAGDYPLFVEFRNDTWNRPEVFPFLKANRLGYVNVDEPRLRGLLPPQAILTTDTGYVRFHGRNTAQWWKGSNESRYFYQYRPDELQEWLAHLRTLIKRSGKTYLFFNNHPQGNAVKNALELKKMLDSAPLD